MRTSKRPLLATTATRIPCGALDAQRTVYLADIRCENDKASHATTAPQSRARTAQKAQDNDLSRFSGLPCRPHGVRGLRGVLRHRGVQRGSDSAARGSLQERQHLANREPVSPSHERRVEKHNNGYAAVIMHLQLSLTPSPTIFLPPPTL